MIRRGLLHWSRLRRVGSYLSLADQNLVILIGPMDGLGYFLDVPPGQRGRGSRLFRQQSKASAAGILRMQLQVRPGGWGSASAAGWVAGGCVGAHSQV